MATALISKMRIMTTAKRMIDQIESKRSNLKAKLIKKALEPFTIGPFWKRKVYKRSFSEAKEFVESSKTPSFKIIDNNQLTHCKILLKMAENCSRDNMELTDVDFKYLGLF